jgi:hypothetical protein
MWLPSHRLGEPCPFARAPIRRGVVAGLRTVRSGSMSASRAAGIVGFFQRPPGCRKDSVATLSCEPLDIIVSPLFPQFGDELPGGALQGGGALTFAGVPVVARKAAAELTNCNDDKVPQSSVR